MSSVNLAVPNAAQVAQPLGGYLHTLMVSSPGLDATGAPINPALYVDVFLNPEDTTQGAAIRLFPGETFIIESYETSVNPASGKIVTRLIAIGGQTTGAVTPLVAWTVKHPVPEVQE